MFERRDGQLKAGMGVWSRVSAPVRCVVVTTFGCPSLPNWWISALFQVRKDRKGPPPRLHRAVEIRIAGPVIPPTAGWKRPQGRLVVQHRQPQLFLMIHALQSSGRLPGRLDRRQQQGDQDPNNGNYDQQLDQRETPKS